MPKIHLTLPCKYSLSDFEQRSDGYFCSSCSHTLTDFRTLADEEITKAIAEAPGSTCGIFNPSQVTSRSTTFQLGLQRRIGLSLLGILGFVSPAVLTSCNDGSPAPEASKQEEAAFSKLRFPLVLRGMLVDKETKQAVTNAQIGILQNGKALLNGKTDDKGRFRITLKEGDLSATQFDLVLEKFGFQSDTLRDLKTTDSYRMSHLQLTIEAKNDDSEQICKPGQVEATEPTMGTPANR